LINLSDPHGAEFATQQKKQIMREKYVSHIWKKNNRVSHISKLISPSPIYPNDRAQVQKVHTTVLAKKKKKKKKVCAL
jgi:hypothetical protein